MKGTINLMYHDVYDHDTNESGFVRPRDIPYKLSVAQFEKQVKEISDYCVKANIDKDSVVFTFDDGGKSFYTLIAPILEKYHYKGIFFISTKYIGTKTFLNESEIIELHNHGHLIGSHAYSHEHLYRLSDIQLEQEWSKSVHQLEEILNLPITYASIPNGDCSERVLKSAYKSGIRHIYTSEPTTKVVYYEQMLMYGRYVVLSKMSLNQVLRIVSSPFIRFAYRVKRFLISLIKRLLGDNYLRIKKYFF